MVVRRLASVLPVVEYAVVALVVLLTTRLAESGLSAAAFALSSRF